MKFEVNNLKDHFPAEWHSFYYTFRKYATYLQEQIDAANGDYTPDRLPARVQAPGTAEIVLERDNQGFPLMPPLTEKMMGKQTMKLMHAYINAQYST